jgi:hypothetical protein
MQKIKASYFGSCILPDSPAAEWYDERSQAVKGDYEALLAEFTATWVGKKDKDAQAITVIQKMERCRLADADVGKASTNGGKARHLGGGDEGLAGAVGRWNGLAREGMLYGQLVWAGISEGNHAESRSGERPNRLQLRRQS